MRNAEDWTECTELTKSIETRSASASLGATHRAFAFYSEIPFSSIETRSAPALTRCCPGSFTFYLGNPISSIETRSAPALTRCYPRSFTFYLGNPFARDRRGPHTAGKLSAPQLCRIRVICSSRLSLVRRQMFESCLVEHARCGCALRIRS
jgi:hypothetical protein